MAVPSDVEKTVVDEEVQRGRHLSRASVETSSGEQDASGTSRGKLCSWTIADTQSDEHPDLDHFSGDEITRIATSRSASRVSRVTSRRGQSHSGSQRGPKETVVSFQYNDPDFPNNWPTVWRTSSIW